MRKLSYEQKDALYKAAKLASDASRNHMNRNMSVAKKKMIAAGVKFTSPDKAPWIEKAKSVHREFSQERGPEYISIIDDVYENAKN